MKPNKSVDMDFLFNSILSLKTVDECYLFFDDVCTIKELQAITQRMQVARQLYANKNYNQVYEDTGVSSATICRVNKCLQYGGGGYKLVLDRVAAAQEDENGSDS